MASSSTPVILVTAGSAGLGAATARLFAQHGYRVAVNYLTNAQRAEVLCAELGGGGHIAIQADLGSRNDVERLVQEAHAQMGRLDVVFSNGGWTRFSVTTSLDDNAIEADWDRAFAINVKSHLWLLQAARPHLDETEGAFVTTSSIAGVQGMGSSLAYSATKAAQIHMIRGLATMVAPKIRVNSVSPGLLQTEWAERFSKEQKEAHRQKTKLGRFVAVEDVAAQVLSLATSKSMTGANIIIDAGYTI
ncbi:Short-chain dehydrogenase/reductase SDR [Penicillium camemberti]|uniref:Short-chain dehydrogenase/reductase SDR n=1 Tax=Penicillium camemberti (strain FM 013) TaxID=1429867 RepID=A0A0G4PQP8_PENC3|nr:Short-chain dehydrogenase/reductase SDR [Penicillium camemberti]